MSDLDNSHLMGWITDGRPVKEIKDRLSFGGITANSYVHLKTPSGEVISYPLNVKIKKGAT